MSEAQDYLQSPDDEWHLGCLLVSVIGREWLTTVLERVDPEDFYNPVLGMLWSAGRVVHARGDRLSKRTLLGECVVQTASLGFPGRTTAGTRVPKVPAVKALLEQVSGEPVYVDQIPSNIERVRHTARMRRLVQTLERAREHVVTAGDYPQALEITHELLGGLEEADAPDEAVPFRELLTVFEKTMAAGGTQGEVIPTPWPELNELMSGGLHPGRTCVIGGQPGDGKALSLDTPLPTTNGWTTMGAVRVGDEVYGADGLPTTVVAATDVMYGRPCYKVTFSDGSVIVADALHRWITDTDRSRKGYELAGVRTTEEIANTVRWGSDHRANHSVVLAKPLSGSPRPLPVPPYTLGAWLGDGSKTGAFLTLNRLDADEIQELISNEGFTSYRVPSGERPGSVGVRVEGLISNLRDAMVIMDKHIPGFYLRASRSDRESLLAGLMDTDGFCDKSGRQCELTLTCKRLAMDSFELIISLGYRATIHESDAILNKRVVGRRWRITFVPIRNPFRVVRKASRPRPPSSQSLTRYITDVTRVDSVPVRCIQVDNADHLYLAGETMIPTHNSIAGLDIARSAAEQGFPTLVVSVEMDGLELTGRALASGARVEYSEITRWSMSEDTAWAVTEYSDQHRDMPLWVCDRADMTVERIAALATGIQRKHGLALLMIDYLQLLEVSDRSKSREQQVADISRAVTRLGKRLGCVVVVLAQLNRENAKTNRRPTKHDLRESGALGQNSHNVLLLHHEKAPDGSPTGMVTLILDKNRHGRTGDVVVRWRGHQARIGD